MQFFHDFYKNNCDTLRLAVRDLLFSCANALDEENDMMSDFSFTREEDILLNMAEPSPVNTAENFATNKTEPSEMDVSENLESSENSVVGDSEMNDSEMDISENLESSENSVTEDTNKTEMNNSDPMDEDGIVMRIKRKQELEKTRVDKLQEALNNLEFDDPTPEVVHKEEDLVSRTYKNYTNAFVELNEVIAYLQDIYDVFATEVNPDDRDLLIESVLKLAEDNLKDILYSSDNKEEIIKTYAQELIIKSLKENDNYAA